VQTKGGDKKMLLTKQVVIKRSDNYYEMLDGFCIKAKNLYNKALYEMRTAYFKKDVVPTCNNLDKEFRQSEQEEYRAMPMAHSAQGNDPLTCLYK
jgi:hypothetical protein